MKEATRIPVILDHDTREIVTVEEKAEPLNKRIGQKLFDYSQPLFQTNLFVSTDKIVNHFTEALCILLGCKNGGLADKAPIGKKVYLAQAGHSCLDSAVKLLCKQLKPQVSFRSKTALFTEIKIQRKLNYSVKIKLYLEN